MWLGYDVIIFNAVEEIIMVADILHSLANNTDDSDGVAQLVVTALGSGGKHYICWKTHSGEYRQRMFLISIIQYYSFSHFR